MSDSAEERARALVGKTLGESYRLDALIGQGAMGAVYRATTGTGAEVALKTLSAEVMGPQTTQRFLRESELVRGLKHPHVVRTLDSGADRVTGILFLVMPLLKGRDLDRIIEDLGALEPETAVRIALQAARGLSAAHRIGIVHRDVKPGNLILDEEDGEVIVRVCDFGIAKQLGGDSELTATGSPLGTPDYVSPEQLKNSKHVDERTDVWSLGATLYQLLCGAAPFSHIDTVFDVITAILSEPPPHLQDRAPWVEPALALVVHRALQRDPNQRWATLEDMADALRPFSGGDELLDAARIVAASNERKRTTAARADLSQAQSAASRPLRRVGKVGQSVSEQPSAAPKELRPTPRHDPSASSAAAAKPRDAGGTSKGAMLAVALLSAAVAGGAAYYFARGAATASYPAVPEGAPPGTVPARVAIDPPDAAVSTPLGPIAVINGTAALQGHPGETLNVTVQHRGTLKTFTVSLGSDGTASPSRLVLSP